MRMRLSIATAGIVLALTGWIAPIAAAQEVGVKGGFTFASLPITNNDTGQIYTGKLHTGLVGGGFVTFPASKSLTFETDVLVNVKGTRDGSEHIKLTYLEIPVLVRFINYDYHHTLLHAYLGPS